MSLHEAQYICQTLHLIIEFAVKLVHLLRIEKILQKCSQNGFIHNTKENINHGAILNWQSNDQIRHSMRPNRSEFPSSFYHLVGNFYAN